MKDFLTKNFNTLLIVGVILFLYFKGVFTIPVINQPPSITIVADTSDKNHEGTTVHQQPVQVKLVPYPVEVVREVMLDSAMVRKVVEDYFSTRVQNDTLHLPDSLGHVAATTHTSKNNVDSIKWDYKIKERTITNNITIREPYKPKRQFFVGGEVSGPVYPNPLVQQAEVGILFKNKKEQVIGVTGGYNFPTKQPVVGLKYYKAFGN